MTSKSWDQTTLVSRPSLPLRLPSSPKAAADSDLESACMHGRATGGADARPRVPWLPAQPTVKLPSGLWKVAPRQTLVSRPVE